MPLRILKLAIAGETETTVNPEITRFFHELDAEVGEGALTLAVGDFETDAGEVATALPELTAGNSYFNCYVNGVLQMDGITAYTPGEAGVGQLIITVGTGEIIPAGTTIVLEIVNYSPASSVDFVT